MHKRNLIKIFLFSIFILLVFSNYSDNSFALTITKRHEMGIVDEEGSGQDDNYLQPDSIYIVPITIESGENISEIDWYQGIHYYQKTKLNQRDFLFHYLITKNGQVIEGNLKGPEQRLLMEDKTNKPIIIAYMSGKNDIDFDTTAKIALQDLLLELGANYAIDIQNIKVSGVEFVAKSNSPVEIRFKELGGKWAGGLSEIIFAIKDKYKIKEKEIQFAIEKIELPINAVNYGDKVVMNITIKNTSKYIVLKGSTNEPFINLASGNSSKFFVNNVWISLTQSPILPEGGFIRANESKTFQVRLGTPLYFGEQAESFYLIDQNGKKYANSDFVIKLNINKPAQKVIEISGTVAGVLNMRQNPWFSAEVISRVSEKQRFIVLEETSEGWYKVQVSNLQGWILKRYTKVIQ